jgi:hypothetical protein
MITEAATPPRPAPDTYRAGAAGSFTTARWQREALLLLLYSYAAVLVTYPLVTYWNFSTFEHALVEDLMGGTAYKPYVFRRLVPEILLALRLHLPDWVIERLASLYHVNSFFPHTAPPGLGTTMVLFCCVAFGCFLGFAYALRRLIRHFYPEMPVAAQDLAPVAALGLLPLFYRYYAYVYDPSTLLLSALGLLFLATNRPLYYAATFGVACYNRESSVLLVIVFVVFYAARLPRGILAAWTAVQLGFWTVVSLGIRYKFRDNPVNPDNPAQFHLFTHNLALPRELPWSFLYFAVVVGLGWWLVARDWHRKPLVLRHAFLCTMLPLAGVSMFIGFIDELRVYFDEYAMFFLLILPSVLRLFGGDRGTSAPFGLGPASEIYWRGR